MTFDFSAPITLGEITSIILAITAIVALAISVRQLVVQRNFNKKSVMPIPEIRAIDYENDIGVRIRNNGMGPLICLELSVSKGSDSKDHLIDWMPTDVTWDSFIRKSDFAVSPTQEIILLRLTGDSEEGDFTGIRDECRAILKDLTIKIKYRDIYGMEDVAKKKLEWFDDDKKRS